MYTTIQKCMFYLNKLILLFRKESGHIKWIKSDAKDIKKSILNKSFKLCIIKKRKDTKDLHNG